MVAKKENSKSAKQAATSSLKTKSQVKDNREQKEQSEKRGIGKKKTVSGQVSKSTASYKKPSTPRSVTKVKGAAVLSKKSSSAKVNKTASNSASVSSKTASNPSPETQKGTSGKTAVKQTDKKIHPKKAIRPIKETGGKTVSKIAGSKKKPIAKSPSFPKMKWGSNATLSFEATSQLPPPELTSIAGGFIFYEDRLLLANIPGRGWEIVGGRIDVGEMPEDTFKREALNQVGVNLEHVQMLGILRIDHSGPEPPNCPYPFPVGYGVQFVGIASELPYFRGSSDSLGRSLVTEEGFQEHYYEWNEFYDAIFHYAYEVYHRMKKKLKIQEMK
ncbi:MAG: NUDIX domain-containing protein [bacterium]